MKAALILVVTLLAVVPRCLAPPPLETGDVPTADKRTFEWYVGALYQKGEKGDQSWLLPSNELVYGLTDRQELTLGIAGLSQNHEYGVRDTVVGTKLVFVKETERLPGLAGSFELKVPTGDKNRGLGSGEFDYDLRLRAQRTWRWFTLIGNAGYTFVTEPSIGGVREPRENVGFLSAAQEYEISKKFQILSEIYWVSREEPGQPNTLVGQAGFRYSLRDNWNVHTAVGKSLREANRGGPDIRAYVGLEWIFDPFPRRKE